MCVRPKCLSPTIFSNVQNLLDLLNSLPRPPFTPHFLEPSSFNDRTFERLPTTSGKYQTTVLINLFVALLERIQKSTQHFLAFSPVPTTVHHSTIQYSRRFLFPTGKKNLFEHFHHPLVVQQHTVLKHTNAKHTTEFISFILHSLCSLRQLPNSFACGCRQCP
jgi:hypothetical protein